MDQVQAESSLVAELLQRLNTEERLLMVGKSFPSKSISNAILVILIVSFIPFAIFLYTEIVRSFQPKLSFLPDILLSMLLGFVGFLFAIIGSCVCVAMYIKDLAKREALILYVFTESSLIQMDQKHTRRLAKRSDIELIQADNRIAYVTFKHGKRMKKVRLKIYSQSELSKIG